jgi:hypothetical protein
MFSSSVGLVRGESIVLKKRYPSQEDVFGEDQQSSSPDTSRDMQDKSEIERLVFKFGLRVNVIVCHLVVLVNNK